jgi:hypothetical protein
VASEQGPLVSTTLSHLPQRPDWRCLACQEEWPCLGARADLLTEYADARPSLGMYLAAHMMDAVLDLGRPLDAELYDRFLAWVRPREPRPAWLSQTPRVSYNRRDIIQRAQRALDTHVPVRATGRCAACGADRCPQRARAISVLYSRYAHLRRS